MSDMTTIVGTAIADSYQMRRISAHAIRENLDRQFDESRSLLGMHLRLYQIHSATLASGVLDDPEVVSRLAELRDDGLLIGF